MPPLKVKTALVYIVGEQPVLLFTHCGNDFLLADMRNTPADNFFAVCFLGRFRSFGFVKFLFLLVQQTFFVPYIDQSQQIAVYREGEFFFIVSIVSKR